MGRRLDAGRSTIGPAYMIDSIMAEMPLPSDHHCGVTPLWVRRPVLSSQRRHHVGDALSELGADCSDYA